MEDKLASVNWREAECGAPILVDALAWFECTVAGELASGDHVLVLGKVVDGGLLDVEGSPLYYSEFSGFDSSSHLLPDTIKP